MEPAEYILMDQAEASMWWYRALHTRLIGALQGVRGRVLDAGCGTGGFLAALGRQRPDLTCFGLEWDLHAARRACAKSGVPVAGGSVLSMPWQDAQFDAVVSADVLCHAAVDPRQALSEMRRILRAGGRLVVNLPAYRWLMSAHDLRVHNARRFTKREVAALLRQAGFAAVQAHYWNGLLLPLMALQRKLLKRGAGVSDVAAFPPWLDATFHAMTDLERRLPLGMPMRLPAGGSVLAIAEKP